MNVLESTQYQAALAVTGAWRGSNTDKMYEELGWESLHHRRNFRRLSMYYKIVKEHGKENIMHNYESYSGGRILKI